MVKLLFEVDNIHFAKRGYKHLYAGPGHLLIDDHSENIDGWIENGGYGILHKDLDRTLKHIKLLQDFA